MSGIGLPVSALFGPKYCPFSWSVSIAVSQSGKIFERPLYLKVPYISGLVGAEVDGLEVRPRKVKNIKM